MQATLHKGVLLTFAVEQHAKKWEFDKVVTITLSPEVVLIGRSCTSGAHPFHLHPPGFAQLVRSASSEPTTIPQEGIVLIEEWNNTGRGIIGLKERKLKAAEEALKRWFEGLT